MTPEQHRVAAAELILERARYGEQLSVLKHLKAAGIKHTVEDAKAIFALIGTAVINVWFPGDRAPMSHPYARALLAEIDKLNTELGEAMSMLARIGDAISPTGERPEEALGTLVRDVEAIVEQLAEVNDRCEQTAVARDRLRRERDAERNAHGATHSHGFAFDLGARGLADHPWQEYNAHGYLCHYPGCQMTPDEHEETK